MNNLQIKTYLFAAVMVGWFAPTQLIADAKPAQPLPPFNQIVLEQLAKYPTDGTHTYWWPRSGESSYDGCTTDLYLDGEQVMTGEEKQRTFCCGLTLEVFLKSFNKLDPNLRTKLKKESNLSPETWAQFQRLWFVLELNGPGPSLALEEYNLGKTITADEALPGDFVQIWRTNNSGHSVIFIDWVTDADGNRTGIKYWSTQKSTQGIGENIEYIANPGDEKGVVMKNTYFGRVILPTEDSETEPASEPASRPTSQPTEA
jgi:hypothetical protein